MIMNDDRKLKTPSAPRAVYSPRITWDKIRTSVHVSFYPYRHSRIIVNWDHCFRFWVFIKQIQQLVSFDFAPEQIECHVSTVQAYERCLNKENKKPSIVVITDTTIRVKVPTKRNFNMKWFTVSNIYLQVLRIQFE
jgi:hypothetical protein